jgi:hypothetical protein
LALPKDVEDAFKAATGVTATKAAAPAKKG